MRFQEISKKNKNTSKKKDVDEDIAKVLLKARLSAKKQFSCQMCANDESLPATLTAFVPEFTSMGMAIRSSRRVIKAIHIVQKEKIEIPLELSDMLLAFFSGFSVSSFVFLRDSYQNLLERTGRKRLTPAEFVRLMANSKV